MTTPSLTSVRSSQRGTSFVELMIALSIVGIALLVMLQQLTISHRENDLGREKVFAYQKALGMLAELQSAVDRGVIADGLELEALEDLEDNPALTTLTVGEQPLDPGHPMSGNVQDQGNWRWYRRLYVDGVPSKERMRYVKVEMKRCNRAGKRAVVASVAGVISLPPTASPSMKQYDVYLLALAGSPSSWQPMPVVRSMVEAASQELMARNPGLGFRLHWITRYGYGRDPLYAPYVNREVAADVAAPWAYWYPGKLARGTDDLFVAERFGGRVRTESGFVNDYDATMNPLPFAVADQFNHAMRTPRARALFEQRVQLGLDDPDEPPLQLLLDDLWSDPERFANAVIVNLHGSGLPFPPMRNYSDAAKDPIGHPGVRVVTHPARLRTPRDPDADGDNADTRDLELRVYAYKTRTDGGANVLTTPITVQIFGKDLTQNVNGADTTRPTTLGLRRLRGGVDPRNGDTGGPNEYYAFDSSEGLPPTRGNQPADHPFAMSYEIGFVAGVESYTWIRLYNTPLIARRRPSGGLDSAERLWGLEYIPSPVVAAGDPSRDFPVDLATVGRGPKNTARWRIRIPAAAFDAGFPGGRWDPVDTTVRVATRLGTDLTTGVAWPIPNQPLNASTTWAWWAASPDAVPLTERYQWFGDPRHNPYVDLVADGDSFPHGYNWHFDDLRDSSNDAAVNWPAFDPYRLRDGFGPGVLADVPRILQTWRDALQAGSSLFTNPGGRLAGTLLCGGEIALPPAADIDLEAPTPVPLHGDFYAASQVARVDSISQSLTTAPTIIMVSGRPELPAVGQAIVRDGASRPFWNKAWIGELFPDGAFATYQADGNLATSNGFFRQVLGVFAAPDHPVGTDLRRRCGARLGDLGGASWIQIGSSGSTFAQVPQRPEASFAPTTDAQDIFMAAGIGLPAAVPGRLPFGFQETLSRGLSHTAFSDYPDHYVQELQRYADGPPDRIGAAVLRVLAPVGGRRMFATVFGDTPVTAQEHDWLASASLLLTLRSFHVAGEPSFDNQFDEVPRLLVTSPPSDETLADPSSVLMRWRTKFQRFDGLRYTDGYPEEFVGPESDLVYVVMYSADEGASWWHAVDGTPATPGSRPDDSSLMQADQGLGDESFLMPLPTVDFPAGEYAFRIDCLHSSRLRHMSHHTVNLWIQR